MEEIVNNSEVLCEFLKKMIVETLRLENITVEEIDSNAPLFKKGLGLDSIDALELVVAIERIFDVIIEDEEVGKKAFASIKALAKFIRRKYKSRK